MKYFLALILIAVSAQTFAAERVPGVIVYANGPVNVTFLIPTGIFGGGPNTEAMQKRVRYIDPKGKKRWLKPDQAKEFSFTLEGQRFRMVSKTYLHSLFSSTVFLLQLIDGPVKMFEHRVTTSGTSGVNGMGSMPSTTINYLLQRGDEPLNEPNVFGFKKEMAKYFADCPALVALIEEKEFKRRDIGEIVLFYNNRCKGS
ncbi:MAG TPA: hypothetical protein VK508_17250 [Cyclobacteriaceae bacterium]|nr:hypothetical protein [Cyclobacteriaceae bacterium]